MNTNNKSRFVNAKGLILGISLTFTCFAHAQFDSRGGITTIKNSSNLDMAHIYTYDSAGVQLQNHYRCVDKKDFYTDSPLTILPGPGAWMLEGISDVELEAGITCNEGSSLAKKSYSVTISAESAPETASEIASMTILKDEVGDSSAVIKAPQEYYIYDISGSLVGALYRERVLVKSTLHEKETYMLLPGYVVPTFDAGDSLTLEKLDWAVTSSSIRKFAKKHVGLGAIMWRGTSFVRE